MGLFAERRRRVLDAIDGVAIIPAAPVTIRNNDVKHEYRQDSDLFWLTGFDEPESVLILSTVHPEHRQVMFLRPRDPEREVWDGARVGVEDAKERFELDATFPIDELAERLPSYLSGAPELLYELARQGERVSLDDQVLAAISHVRGRGRSAKSWPTKIMHPEPVWHEMRLTKDDQVLASMRRAAEISTEAHLSAMAQAAPGKYEYEIEALFREVFRRHGSQRAAYTPIIGSGPNATVLHYHANNRQLEDGDLLLIDAGCEYDYYACDVTRTFPVSGRFSDAQKMVYEAVLDAQLAAIEATRPGSTIEQIHRMVLRQLTEGMVRIGLLEGEVDELIAKEAYRRYYMHRTSHWLGMDVHDVGAYFIDGKSRPLVPGMVLTIEPGIYISAEDDRAPAELRGIGVRIEDDILVTESGYDNLTAGIPRTIEQVERACQA